MNTGPGWAGGPFRALLALAALIVVVRATALDRTLADLVFRWEGGAWALRHHWLTSALLHEAGGRAVLAAWLAIVAAWLLSRTRNPPGHRASALGYLALTLPAGPLAVAALKELLPIACPWDLVPYGGALPLDEAGWVGLFGSRSPAGGCFPAGHASGGYAFVALYFALRERGAAWRRAGLAAGLALGLAFGIAQQLRGAHFLSHDLWTLAICWSIALAADRVRHARRAARRVPAQSTGPVRAPARAGDARAGH